MLALRVNLRWVGNDMLVTIVDPVVVSMILQYYCSCSRHQVYDVIEHGFKK